MKRGELSVCTFETYVEGAYRYFALHHKRELPTPGEIFAIVINMWESQGLLEHCIWCSAMGANLEIRDVRLEDIEFVLEHKRMAYINEYSSEQRFEAQIQLLRRY